MNVVKGKIRPIRDHILAVDMEFGEVTTTSGIVLKSDDGKAHGVKPRWARVYKIGTNCELDVKVGEWILIEHGRWTRKIKIDDGAGVKEIQKVAGSLIVYDQTLNQTVVRFLEKAGVRAMFDIALHLEKDPSGPNLGELKKYAASIKAFQAKAKKDTLAVYIMSDNYSTITHFQTYCDPSWKITALCKTPSKDSDSAFIQAMAEVQIMTAVPALILDFERPVDRFIHLMQRNPRLNYFVEMNDAEWHLLDVVPVNSVA